MNPMNDRTAGHGPTCFPAEGFTAACHSLSSSREITYRENKKGASTSRLQSLPLVVFTDELTNRNPQLHCGDTLKRKERPQLRSVHSVRSDAWHAHSACAVCISVCVFALTA